MKFLSSSQLGTIHSFKIEVRRIVIHNSIISMPQILTHYEENNICIIDFSIYYMHSL